MSADHFVQCRVSAETKAALRAAAARQQVSESVALRRVLDFALGGATVAASAPQPLSKHAGAKRRLYVRIRPDDAALLEARAEARSIAPATYASIVLRSHLQGAAPIPKAELEALRSMLSQLAIVERRLRAIQQLVAGLRPVDQNAMRAELGMFVKVCTAMRDHTHKLLAANLKSWSAGRAGE